MPKLDVWRVLAATAIVAVAVAAVYASFARAWVAQDLRRALRRPVTWLVGAPTLLFVMVIAVPYLYLESTGVDTPPPMTFDDVGFGPGPTTSTTATATTETTSTLAPVDLGPGTSAPTVPTTTTTAPGPVDGRWAVGQGSQARYGIDDTILGQKQRVVGSTEEVTGDLVIAQSTVQSAEVVVDMRSVRCGCVHDDKYQDLLDTEQYPTSTFDLTTPIALAAIPPDGEIVRIPVTGRFTIHGVTRTVRFELEAVREQVRIAIKGTIPIRLEDYGIENPDAGALGGLSNPTIDLLIAFDRVG